MSLVSFILLLVILYYVIGRAYYIPTASDEVYFALTEDGFRLALYRYIPSPLVSGREPVILCHGLSSNRYSLDFDESHSLARYLRSRGLDCWVVELRGRGLSDHSRVPFKPWGWCFDDYLLKDIPAIIKTVKRITESEKVHWVGHSMGGMLMHAYLGTVERESIKSYCTIGSPAKFNYHWYPLWLRSATRFLLDIIPFWPNRFFARIISPVFSVFNTERYGYDPRVVSRFFSNGVSNVSSNVFKQFLDWIETGDFFSADRKKDYQAGLENINTPYLCLCGSFDWMAPPSKCRFTFDRISSADKKFVVLGREGGQSMEYDHMSMLLGVNAQTEVFPLVSDFFLRRSSA